MAPQRHRTLLVLLWTLVLIHAVKPKVKGLSPVDISALQFDENEFRCRDNSKTLPFSQVNDNYCDCQDGSDEPGTPACSNGRFWCRNVGYVGNEIFSTQVWDGICDCCDGSDERELKTKCKNTCLEKAAVARAAHEKEMQLQQQGLNKKKEYIALAKKDLAEKAQQLNTLKEEGVKLQEEKKRAEEEQRIAEEAAKVKELEVQREAEAKKAEQQGEEKTDEDANVEPIPTEQTPQEPEKAVVTDESKKEIEEEDDWDESIDELKPYSEETKKASEAVKQAENAIAENDKKVREIEELLASDFGEENAFYYLHGNLYTVDVAEYTYELRPFDGVTQKPRGGSSGTSLGKWDLSKQTDAWKVSYKEMLYSDGLKCWGGPDRSTTVTILCGSETKIAEPNEPNKCEYTLKLYTPSACNEKHLQVLQLNFGEQGQEQEVI